MNRTFAKSERIGQVQRLLLSSRVPLTQADIARRCQVHRSTIGRMVQGMIDEGIPLRYDDEGRIYIERTAYISTIRLRLHEALALFLAGRMLARYSDKATIHTVEALDKLGISLQAVMPELGAHITRTSADLRERLPKQASHYQRVLETLTNAWAEGKKVQLWYRPLKSRKAFQHTFAPYFLEPSAIGYSTYAIGLAEPPGKLRTRKLERIERITATAEPYDVPADFDPNKLLAGAWGIWFDDEDQPTAVTLRFSHFVARRVQETRWHPSQRVEEDDEGRLIWRAEIDAVEELLPWIRGWGADCEVLEPALLRERMLGEIRLLTKRYGLNQAGADDRQERFSDIFG
ncbi:MAG TPA: WYL domain-containing protein [Herpetosiphonaceae bacterium]|nr:WYL domain-containing protein [Herpetosiphonaceae bacterium]